MAEASSVEEVVWIAGVGASAGLGAALARRFARAGLTAVVTGRTPERLELVAREIREAGGRAYAEPGDVRLEAELTRIAARVSQIGHLRVAIYNASSAVRAPSLEISAGDFEDAWRTTTLGGFLFARESVRALLPSGGALFFTGATASRRGKPPFTAFAAAKAGLRSVSQSFAREFGPRGVHVAHVIIDGGIDGERWRTRARERGEQPSSDGLLGLDAISEAYFQLYAQDRSAWTQELDLRPYREPF